MSVDRVDPKPDAGAVLPGLGYERRECVELWVKDADPYEIRIVSGVGIGWRVEVRDTSIEEIPVSVEAQWAPSLASAIQIADRILSEDHKALGDSIF